MDVVTYALLKKQVDNVSLAYEYKGSVTSVENLPADATVGDLYTISSDGTEYVWDGTQWLLKSKLITDAQIDALP